MSFWQRWRLRYVRFFGVEAPDDEVLGQVRE